MKLPSILFFLFLFLNISHGHEDTESKGHLVILTDAGVENLGIQTFTAKKTEFERSIFALGRIESIPAKKSIISSRISGRVLESRVCIGEKVHAGEKLLKVESRQAGNPPPSIWLEAPADGTILSVNTNPGAPVEPDSSLVRIADLDTVYLVAIISQDAAGKLGPNTIARVKLPLFPEQQHTAKFLNFGTHLLSTPAMEDRDSDPADINNTEVVFALENPDGKLRPGMSAECSIVIEKRDDIISAPREAVHGNPSQRHVWVVDPELPNAFEKKSVQVGEMSNNRVEIVSGIEAGDLIVTRGSYSLGFAGEGAGLSLKEALDQAHGHAHNEDGSEMTDEQGAIHDNEAGNDTRSVGSPLREKFFMATTALLFLLLILSSFKRSS